MVNRLSVKVSAPRMDGSSVWLVGGLIVAAGRLSRTVGGEYFSSLLEQDRRTQQAVVMSLIVPGEAATKVMDQHSAFAAEHSHIPWRSMRGMRNRIAHGYFEINLEVVWDTVQTALPVLKTPLDALPSSI